MTWLKEWYPVVKLFFYSFSIYLPTVKCGSPNAAKNKCWNERRVYAHMETYIWGFTGHGAGMNISNKVVYQDQFNNSNIHSIKKCRNALANQNSSDTNMQSCISTESSVTVPTDLRVCSSLYEREPSERRVTGNFLSNFINISCGYV